MEINPPHYGHQYFLEQIPKSVDDILVVVVSGYITQRGELSVMSKTDKAQFLLQRGADIVINLPSIYANQGGFYFAKHSLDILKAFNITDLYFGSESADLALLKQASLKTCDKNFEQGIYKNQLTMLNSNDILAISYLKNIDSSITPHVIKRINNDYNQTTKANGLIQSATYIRNHLDDPDVKLFVPNDVYPKIHQCNLDWLLPTLIINLDYSIEHNLDIFLSEHRELLYKIKKVIMTQSIDSFETLVKCCSDKNNSQHKIRRLLLNIIFLVTTTDATNQPLLLQLTGASKQGCSYIKQHQINVVTSLKNIDSQIAKKEIMIGYLYKALSGQSQHQDFDKPVIK